MPLSFANPAGFLALLCVPAILAIHLFQRRARRVVTATLFLVDESPVASIKGSRLDRLRRSPTLWLQLTAAVIATWLLVQPRWIRPGSLQRVALVVDASASMSAFREPLASALEDELATIARTAAHTEWAVLASASGEATLYAGGDGGAALAAAGAADSRLGMHDPTPALQTARAIAGAAGRVVLVTDHAVESAGVEVLAVGAPIDNVGFAGVELGHGETGLEWRAVVKNSGRAAASREWWLEISGARTPAATLTLGAGEIRVLSGIFPASSDAVELALAADRFSVDDRLPLVRPRPKILRVWVAPELREQRFIRRFLDTVAPVERFPDPGLADLVLAVAGGGSGPPPFGAAAIVFLASEGDPGRLVDAPTVAAADPLVADLSWRGLIVTAGAGFAPAPGDRGLVWQGERPLLFRRRGPRADHLHVNFVAASSSAPRLPAFVLALNRFAGEVRAAKVGFEQRNVETGQRLTVAADPDGARVELVGAGGDVLSSAHPTALTTVRAPPAPGFFELRQGRKTILRGAAHFGDVREADLRQAGRRVLAHGADGVGSEVEARHSRSDPLAPLWALALIGLAMATWWLNDRPQRRSTKPLVDRPQRRSTKPLVERPPAEDG